MKISSAKIRLLVSACLLSAATAVFGQTTYTWTGLGDGVTITDTNNWSPKALPSGASQDTALWDGQTTSNLVLHYGSVSLPSTGFNTLGIFLSLSANQTNSVQLICPSGVSAGIGIWEINLDPGAGAFILGDTSGNNLKCFGRPAGAVHPFINNSTNPAIINPSCEWQAGGGNGYTYDFQGTGNWYVTNYLMPDNGSFSPNTVQVDGPGTLFWSAGKTGAYNPNSALATIAINGGALVMESSGLLPNPPNEPIANNGLFVFDAAGQAQTMSGSISGIGDLVVSNGTLTLSGQNSYTGTNILAGGELIVASAENPFTSGPLGISPVAVTFDGGVLGFSVNNVVDYSGQFDTTAGQQYKFDTGGQNVAFTNEVGLSSSGGTLLKLGSGTLTLAGPSTYTGDTTVGVGRLVFQGLKSGSGNIIVSNSATLGVFASAALAPATLTLGNGGTVILDFNDVSSTTTPLINAATLAAPGPVTINVNSGSLTPGQSYPLLKWTSGAAPAVTLGILNGFIGTLSTNGNTIQVNITATAYKWTGAVNGTWDTTTANWLQNGVSAIFANGGPVLFDDSATGATNITVSGVVQPTSVSVNVSTNPYSIASTSGNDIGGSASLLKAGDGTLTLSGGANTYTGVTTVSGGTLIVGALADGGTASDIGAAGNNATNLVIDGGTLQFTGSGANIDRLFTLGTGGGTIDDEASAPWVFNNTGALGYTGNGPRGLTLHGSGTDTNTFAPVIADNGGPTSLTKNGPGLWIVTGNNTYSGVTTIANGTLQVGNGGSTGAIGSGGVVNDGSLDFDRTGSVTVSGAISGTGAVTNDGTGTVILANNNTYTGGTTINAGTVQIGNGGSTGQLDSNSSITNNGTLIFNSSGTFVMNGNISGNGQVIKHGGGLLKLLGTLSYNGGTTIDAGGNLQIAQGIQGVYSGTGTITNNGTLTFIRQDNNVFGITNNIIGNGRVVIDVNNPNNGDTTFLGVNTYTNNTRINGGGLILGDGVTPGAGSIVGNVVMTNHSDFAGNDTASQLVFNHPAGDDITFAGNITGQGSLNQGGSDLVTLTGNNAYTGTTTITNTGTAPFGGLVLSNNGTLGSGAMTLEGGLIFNRASGSSYTYAPTISSTTANGLIVQEGANSTVTLSGPNTNYLGITVVSNGTLVDFQTGGDVDLSGGTLVAGSATGIGTLQIGGNLNMTNGTLQVNLNKSLAQLNSMVVMSNAVSTGLTSATYVGGTLNLVNVGPALQVGDKFTIFNVPVTGGGAMPITSSGATFNNNLAVDGSVTVASVTQAVPPKINQITLVNGTNIVITATNNTGSASGTWTLLATNNLTAPLSTWPVISTGSFGTGGSVSITNTVSGTNRLFYILRTP